MGGASAGGGTPSVQEQTGRDSLSRLGHSIQRAVSSSKVAPGVSLRAGAGAGGLQVTGGFHPQGHRGHSREL